MIKKKLLILYNFEDEESNIVAPNFYKDCAFEIFPKNDLDVFFLPKYKNSFVFSFCLKLGFSQNTSKRVRYLFWYLFNIRKYDKILGWLDLGLLASFTNYISFFRKREVYLILYNLNENKIKSNKFYYFFFFAVSKGTFKLLSLDFSQATIFSNVLNRNYSNTIKLIYGVNSFWYDRFLKNDVLIQKKSIFCPGGAHRDDMVLFNTFKSLDYTVRRFQISSLKDTGVSTKNIGSSIFEFYTNLNYEDYISFCLRSEFVVISVHNSDKPVGLTSLLECMSLGKTILISRGFSSNDYIIDFVTGLLFDNEVELLSKLLFLENNPILSKQIGLNAKKAARKTFDLEITGKNLMNIILN